MKTIIFMCLLLPFMSLFSQEKKVETTSMTNEEFSKIIKVEGVQLIDVRIPEEYAHGHIPLFENIDVNNENFSRRISKLDKNRPVAVYCKGGVRSKKAAKKLNELGYRVYDLDKGISNWNGEVEK